MRLRVGGILGTGLITILLATPTLAEMDTDDRSVSSDPRKFDVLTYIDVGYLASSTRPANHIWRSKGTTNILDELRINNATLSIRKGVHDTSRWGYRLGVQAGTDIDAQVPAENAMSAADALKHLWYTNVTYLAPAGRGLALTGGLIPGHAGYPSFYAIRNGSYTRTYEVDYVPYFVFGLRATYPGVTAPVSGSLYVMNAYNYLAVPNHVPTYGAQLAWTISPDLNTTQNLYYGPDQAATELEFWRFMYDANFEWSRNSYMVAASVTAGTEKQAAVTGQPHFDWVAGSLWLRWLPVTGWRFALRPEFFYDPDGLQTGFRQTITSVAVTAEWQLRPNNQNLGSARIEYRFDRSTGDEGGFYDGADNTLVPDQHLIIGALMYVFDLHRVTSR